MHALANPARFLRIARPLTGVTLLLGVVLVAIGVFGGLLLTPAERFQGESVRILYIHVPTAWLGMAGWSGIAIASLAQLVWRHPLAGIAARAIAVPGALFTGLCLITGSIWGRPTWGTWWEWDGRMTSMLVMLFLYCGYIALSNARNERGSVDRIAAIYGIFGAINLPIIHFSVTWWNTLHQGQSIGFNGSKIAPELLWPLPFTMLGFSMIFVGVVLMRMRALIALNKREARLRRLVQA